MYCWGSNSNGELGVQLPGGEDHTSIPQAVPLPSGVANFTAISTGYSHTCAATDTGEVYCWGCNYSGQLGVVSQNTYIPQKVNLPLVGFKSGNSSDGIMSGPGIMSLTTGNAHTCVVTNVGSLYCWGRNVEGQLGVIGGDASFPQKVLLNGTSNFLAVTAGGSHSCAVANNAQKQLYCWGENADGQLGVPGTGGSALKAVSLPNGVSNLDLSAGEDHTCAVAGTGQLYCWGSNGYSQAGVIGGTDSTPRPVSMGASSATTVSGGFIHSCSRTTTNQVYCWGDNRWGELGAASGTTFQPQQVVPPAPASSFLTMATGYYHSCAVANTGRLYCWGSNTSGQLGVQLPVGIDNTPLPQLVTLPMGVTSFSAVATSKYHTCAVSNNGRVYCWGDNTYGQLGVAGNGGFTPQEVSLPSGISFKAVTTSSLNSCALTTNTGQVYCWGFNRDGQLGTMINSGAETPTLPQQVPLPNGANFFLSVTAGGSHSCAVANTGRVYCWGANYMGQLGVSKGTHYTGPKLELVPLPAGAVSFSKVEAGGWHTCGLDNIGRVYCWGWNENGQLGIEGNGTDVPQQVPLPNGVSSFTALTAAYEHSCGVANTGLIYCWGFNWYGQLGQQFFRDNPTLVLERTAPVDMDRLFIGEFEPAQ